MSLTLDITLEDARWDTAIENLHSLTQNICDLSLRYTSRLENLSPEVMELSVVLADNNFVQDLNARYRNKDKPTNVLSFPQTDWDDSTETSNPILSLGDIIVAFETLETEAKDQDKSLHDHYTHLIIHGLLHLLGYDHESEDEAEEMETLEIQILSQLKIKNPYQK